MGTGPAGVGVLQTSGKAKHCPPPLVDAGGISFLLAEVNLVPVNGDVFMRPFDDPASANPVLFINVGPDTSRTNLKGLLDPAGGIFEPFENAPGDQFEFARGDPNLRTFQLKPFPGQQMDAAPRRKDFKVARHAESGFAGTLQDPDDIPGVALARGQNNVPGSEFIWKS